MRRRGGLVAAAALALAACFDFSTDPDEVIAIELADFPWPSVVAGDTLRDANGAVAPLVARLFDGNGDVVAGAVEFLPDRLGVRVIEGNALVADDTATGQVGILASSPTVQSIVRQLEIVATPVTLAADANVFPLEWVVPDDPQSNTSQAIGARVLAADGTGVRSWVVTFQLEAAGRVIPPGDTTQIFLIGESGQPSSVDTTDVAGRASRRVRLRVLPGLTPPDSAILTLTASYRGVPLAGSPVVLVLPLRAR